MNFNVSIIGAGPAGIACAIQLKRYGITPLIFEKNRVGGLLRNANFVENYPGYPEGVSGLELSNKFNKCLENYNICTVFEEVLEVKLGNNFYEIKTNNKIYISRYLVVASGTEPKKLELPVKKVFYEVCDLFEQDLQDKKIVIIGAGDAAFDYAINLANNSEAREIVILNRGTKTRCLKLLKQRTLENPKIEYFENTELSSGIDYDYVLAAIGREANLNFFCHSGLDPESPEILNRVQDDNPRLFLIGDVKNGIFRQTAIATGDGIKAAMEIYQKLKTPR